MDEEERRIIIDLNTPFGSMMRVLLEENEMDPIQFIGIVAMGKRGIVYARRYGTLSPEEITAVTVGYTQEINELLSTIMRSFGVSDVARRPDKSSEPGDGGHNGPH